MGQRQWPRVSDGQKAGVDEIKGACVGGAVRRKMRALWWWLRLRRGWWHGQTDGQALAARGWRRW